MSGYKSGMKGADVVALLKNGLPIVDDVSKLDPNAELGSMASVVTPGNIQETSFRNLYQPDASIIDKTTGTLTQPELLSSVSSINFLIPTDYSGVETIIVLLPRSFSQTNTTMISLEIAPTDTGPMVGGVYVPIEGFASATNFIIGEVVDGVYTIDDATVTAINDILASDDWCYLGREPVTGSSMTEEQFATLDKLATAVAGVPSIADIYVKGDKWRQLYKKDLDKLASDLDKISETQNSRLSILEDKMPTRISELLFDTMLEIEEQYFNNTITLANEKIKSIVAPYPELNIVIPDESFYYGYLLFNSHEERRENKWIREY